MDLPTYIRAQGVAASAALFQVSKYTAASWMYGQRKPRPTTALEIERKTAGTVTVRECFAAGRG
jgi:DNA-binding transcriptional regulator YdaS (Cro superfamily)